MRLFLPWFILLFPALELFVLIQVGREIGALATIALVILSCIVGICLLRLRGMHIARTMRTELAAGKMPSNTILETFCLMVSGWLFLFPGFISDFMAALLIIPGVRQVLLSFFVTRMRSRGFQGQTVPFASSAGGSGLTTWTCTTFGSASASSPEPADEREPRGNAVVIDCEPEVITGKNKGFDNAKPVIPNKPD